jgi:hypothetical protein
LLRRTALITPSPLNPHRLPLHLCITSLRLWCKRCRSLVSAGGWGVIGGTDTMATMVTTVVTAVKQKERCCALFCF